MKLDSFKKSIEAKKRDRFTVMHGDSLEILRSLNPNQFDSLVTDPPAGIAFMGKDWDTDKGGRDYWISWLTEVLRECYRVMKPGAYGLVWSLPRTSHWTAMACEDSGFDVRDCVMHLFGSGFPKSMNISKAIDKEAGAEREVVGTKRSGMSANEKLYNNSLLDNLESSKHIDITAPASDSAKQWDGYGTALKPSYESWWLIQKPIAEKTIAKNVVKHGTGGLNIDNSRIRFSSEKDLKSATFGTQPKITSKGVGSEGGVNQGYDQGVNATNVEANAKGRFPANTILSHADGCVEVGVKSVGNGDLKQSGKRAMRDADIYGTPNETRNSPDNYGTETVEAWDCVEGCPVKLLDEQSGNRPGFSGGGGGKTGIFKTGEVLDNYQTYSDSGGASRFFYVSKPSKSDKGDDNGHPTVKSTRLMKYLIEMITRPGGTILDPFMGSGTTGVAAIRNNFKFYGIDQESKYTKLAIDRMLGEYKVTDKKLNVKKTKKA